VLANHGHKLVTSWSQTLINLCLQLGGDHCLVSVEEQDRLKQDLEGGKAAQQNLPASISESDFVCDPCLICKRIKLEY
jgi:hypothetical protein